MANDIGKWVLLRLLAPLAVGGIVIQVTWAAHFFDIFNPLVWSLFVTHLLATFAFKRTHLLDTGSFFVLIFACGQIAHIVEARSRGDLRTYSTLAATLGIYTLLSVVGRLEASRVQANRKEVNFTHVVVLVIFLFVAVAVCGTSKTGVGFLFVPGLILVPAILLFALLRRGSTGADV